MLQFCFKIEHFQGEELKSKVKNGDITVPRHPTV